MIENLFDILMVKIDHVQALQIVESNSDQDSKRLVGACL